MSTHNHTCCNCPSSSVTQTLDELDFERGPWIAALSGDLNHLRKNFERNTKLDVDILDSSGYSSLHYASRAGHLDIVNYLTSNGANVNLGTRANHSTPLHRASQQGHLPVVKYLLEHGADPHVLDCRGKSALHLAASENRADVCKLLVSSNPALKNVMDSNNQKPLDCTSDVNLKGILSI